MSKGDVDIAIVHDELTRRGGAEVALEELLRIWPQADVYALYAKRPIITVDGISHTVTTSFLQKAPKRMRTHPKYLLPFLAQAAESFDLSQYDAVISSSSAFAKAVVTRSTVPHISYCHTPTRYLWEQTRKLRWPARGLLHYLRMVDFAAAQRVDYFIANSNYTQKRIAKTYRRESKIICPPVDTDFYIPDRTMPRTHFLCVGRLTPAKYFDQAIEVCEKLELPLVIVGVGAERQRLRRIAGKHTTFVGRISNEKLRDYYRSARAVLQPGIEDFGMASVEALATATPVIAAGYGGSLEIVRDGIDGLLYTPAKTEGLAEAMRRFLDHHELWHPVALRSRALQYSRHRFATAMRQTVHEIVSQNR